MIPRYRPLMVVTVAALTLQLWSSTDAQTPTPAKPDTPAPSTAPPTGTKPAAPPKPAVVQPKPFASAEEAVQALVAALRAGDTKAMGAILGSEGRGLIVSGDPVADRNGRERFLKEYDAANKLVGRGDTTTTLQVGANEWPFPIPLVKQNDRWRFDARQGREEILTRRIGRNELYTMQTCLAVVDAQREYYAQDQNGDGILEYARQFASTRGKHDGLYWPTPPGERQSPLGDLVARARAEGYRRATDGGPTPYYGYMYRILTAQGPNAPGGAHEYVVRGHMIGGFAVVAFPAQYGVSGVMTFMVNQDGELYQKDLGPHTRAAAMTMKTFDPDTTWTKVDAPEIALTD